VVGYRRESNAGLPRLVGIAPVFASSEAARAFRPTVAPTAQSKALVSFGRGHAEEAGIGERRAPASEILGLSAEIARDALVATSETRRVVGSAVVETAGPGVVRFHECRAGATHSCRTGPETRCFREQVSAGSAARTCSARKGRLSR
jgi:hypothetical protein